MAEPSPTQASSPAYASAPPRSGLMAAIAGVLALLVLATVAWFMLGSRPAAPPAPATTGAEVRGADASGARDAARAALEQASKSVLQPPPSSLPPVAAPPAETTAPAVDAAPVPAPAAPRVAAATEAPRPAARPAPVAPPKAMPAVPRGPEPAAAPAPVAPPAQVASADRWTQMRDEMARCSTTSLIPRVQCEQRIRARYCDGYWGAVPDCGTGGRRG
jgi:hypothetical protein